MIRRALETMGLVTEGKYAVAIERLKKAEARALKLAQHVREARAETQTWKSKTAEAQDALRKAQARAAEAIQKAEAKAADAQRQARRAEAIRVEAERRAQKTIDLEGMQKELERSEHELLLAREQLMAVEVKLDILEGAANVLDTRTRGIASRRTTPEDGSSV